MPYALPESSSGESVIEEHHNDGVCGDGVDVDGVALARFKRSEC